MKVEILGICLTPFPIKWAGKAAKQVYHKLRQKDTGSDATSRTFLQGEGSVLVQPLSLAFARQGRVAAPSIRCAPLASCWPRRSWLLPLVGEPLAKPFTLRGLPRPLLPGEVARRQARRRGCTKGSLPITKKAPGTMRNVPGAFRTKRRDAETLRLGGWLVSGSVRCGLRRPR